MPSGDISNNPDFLRLQNLQLSQTQEMAEFRKLVNDNFLEISKQVEKLITAVAHLSAGGETKVTEPCLQSSNPGKDRFQLPFYQSVVDLDKPKYADCILENEDYIPPKNVRVVMPRFDGTYAEGWLFSVRRYFIFYKIPENQKLLLASFHMDGIARKWFAWMEASNLLSDWKFFVDALLRKFTSLHFTLPGGQLSKLIQEGSVQEYIAMFEKLSTRVMGLPDYFLLEMFITGLKEEIQTEVLRDKPGDLKEAIDLALLVESQQSKTKGHYYKPKNQNKNSSYQPFIPKNSTVATTNVEKPNVTAAGPVFKRLSQAERKERQAKGLCYNCDEKYEPSHKCKGRLFRLATDESCLIEMVDMDNVETEDISSSSVTLHDGGQTEISFHAFEGHICPNTIGVEGFIKCQEVSVLLDT